VDEDEEQDNLRERGDGEKLRGPAKSMKVEENFDLHFNKDLVMKTNTSHYMQTNIDSERKAPVKDRK